MWLPGRGFRPTGLLFFLMMLSVSSSHQLRRNMLHPQKELNKPTIARMQLNETSSDDSSSGKGIMSRMRRKKGLMKNMGGRMMGSKGSKGSKGSQFPLCPEKFSCHVDRSSGTGKSSSKKSSRSRSSSSASSSMSSSSSGSSSTKSSMGKGKPKERRLEGGYQFYRIYSDGSCESRCLSSFSNIFDKAGSNFWQCGVCDQASTTMPTAVPTAEPITPAPTAEPITLAPTAVPSTAAPTRAPCGGPCPDDGNLCTLNTCDNSTDTCQVENLPCGASKACDVFTGQCQNIQNVIPCVAVIDEWDNRDYSTQWAEFRAFYPQRPFCLLVPSSGIQFLPTGFADDTVNNPDGIDRTIAVTVNRDNGNTDLVSDWFNACGLDILSPSSITFIGLFIDTSGSMTLSTVQASYNRFLEALENQTASFDQVFNGAERWIDPFFTDLIPPTRGPTMFPTTSKAPSASPTSRPTTRPTVSLEPSVAPTSLPSISPTLSHQPSSAPTGSARPSSLPSAIPTLSPSKSPSAPPMEPSLSPTSNPTDGPTSAPTTRPTTSPVQSPTARPTTSPISAPTRMPTSEPVPTQAPVGFLNIDLATALITAGDPISLVATVTDGSFNPVVPLPPITYGIIFVAAEESGGELPLVTAGATGAIISTFNDTRGVYTVTASTTVDGSVISTQQDFVVLAPAAEDGGEMLSLISQAAASQNAFGRKVGEMEDAIANSNAGLVQSILDEMRVIRDGVDLEALRLTSICQADTGFFPTTAELTAAGFPATPSDILLAETMDDYVKNLINYANALDLGSDLSLLQNINQNAEDLVQTLLSISPPPTVHGYVLIQLDLNYLYAILYPRFIHSQTNALESAILGAGIGVTRRLGEQEENDHERRLFGSLVGGMSAVSIRNKVINDVYGKVAIDIYRSVTVMAFGQLLAGFSDAVQAIDIITGGSVSFNAFEVSNSVIEAIGVNDKYPGRTQVELVGSAQLATAEEVFKDVKKFIKDATKVRNLRQAKKAYDDGIAIIKKVSEGRSTATPDGFAGSCVLLGGNCVALEFTNGFENVNKCEGFVCFPMPVIFIVSGIDSGGFNTRVEQFASK